MERYKLKDICQVVNGRAYKQAELLQEGKYKVLRVGNFFTSDRWYYSDMELDENKYCNNDDLLYAWSASFGPRLWEGDKTIYHYHIWKMIPDQRKVNKYYLYYWLLNNANQLTAGTHGSVMAHITKSSMENENIELPDLDIQFKVSDVLHTIDEKIKTNEKINRNLQDQAKTIYKEMVIDLSESEVTEGILSDIAVITMGQSPKGDTYNEEGNGAVFYQGRAEFRDRFPTRRLFTTEPKRMASPNDVLMSVRAPVGDINVAYEECCIGRGLGAVHSKDDHQSFVLYTMFALRGALDVYNGEGTVFGSINRDAMNKMSIRIPSSQVMDKFEEIVSPIDTMIRKNYEETCRLVSLRDALLPKLMSGELDVSDLDI